MKHSLLAYGLTILLPLLPGKASADTYREKYRAVLEHFSQKASDSLKYRAALFLIDNMEGHFSPEGERMDAFTESVGSLKSKRGIHELNVEWASAGKKGSVTFKPDSSVVTDRMLISNINTAFEVWKSTPWRNDVSFDLFCRYILPYRCSNEHIGGNWRKALFETYSPLVKDETDMYRTFAIIKEAVFKDVVLSNAYCPYLLDAITCLHTGRAECGQRAVLLVDVLRALGIPAAIDFVPVWADYSDKSHGWTAVIGKNGVTYTVFEDDTVAKSGNPIDASTFASHYRTTDTDSFPYPIKRTKTPAKIYREEFELVDATAKSRPGFLSDGFLRDVSERYGLDAEVTLDVRTSQEAMLCTFVSAWDWIPVAWAKSKDGKVTFRHMGKNVVYTARTTEGEYLTAPFLMGEHSVKKFFKPDTSPTRKIQIDRKYPLCQYTVDIWGFMRGGAFLGSETPDFTGADTLAVITAMPHGKTDIKCHSDKAYRCFQYKAPRNNRSSLSELQFLIQKAGNMERLDGIYTADGMDDSHIERLHDDNTATSCRGLTPGYTVTLDLGNGRQSPVSLIRYAPSTDLNFIEKGHLYELYLFDTSWQLIERKIADSDTLTFNGVPYGCLLLLKDKTAGKEERIFEYENNQQVWH